MYESLEECIEQGCEYDTITAWHVLEHVQDPVDFLEKCTSLLKENGKIYLSTPNTDEILMKVLPDDFPKFFYRAWHPYYFTIDSMLELAKHAGLEVLSCVAKHSWGLGNTMSWLRDKKPAGQGLEIEPNQDALIDPVWRAYLEQAELGDTIYMVITKDRRMN
jgi:cyclopropane fatty-acyl-phospholipid synthase-like methyltransferase